MTQDALDSDQLVTIVQASPHDKGNPWAEPVRIPDVGCVGRIIKHEQLADGRFNLLLLGCKRVRLVREIASPKLYRVAEAIIMEDEEPANSDEMRRADLIAPFLEVLQMRHRLDPDLSRLIHSDLPPGILSDIIAHALELAAPLKQALLEETQVVRRISLLLSVLRDLINEIPRSRRFPQPFSPN
jgi:Lon protease-like protein